LLFGQLENMFHPVLSPQLPPSLESLKPVDHLASATVVKIKTDRRKLIIVGKNQDNKYQLNILLVERHLIHNLENLSYDHNFRDNIFQHNFQK
jgi:hypothetical protein